MGEVANIPQLRFPEFSNEWEESKVGKVFKVSAGGDIKTENVSQIKTDGFPYPIYANAEKAKGLYGYSNLYKSEANVVTVAGRGVNIGIAHVRLEPFYPIVRLLVLNPIKDADVKFWENQLNQLNLFVESTGVPQLTAPQISSYKVKYPSKPEQQKIAAFLTAVDNKIEQLSKKQELLSEYKKGVMQQIFSQAIRFKADDGSDFPGWEEKSLGELFNYKNGGSFENEVVKDGLYNLITLNSITIDGELKNEHKKINSFDNSLKINDLIMVLSDVAHGNFLGLTAIIPEDNSYVLNQRMGALKSKGLNNVVFLRLLINYNQKYFKLHGQGSSQQNLSKGDILKFELLLPNRNEQQKIANFLSSIDTKIEQVGKQLDESKQFKKALLQQMFV